MIIMDHSKRALGYIDNRYSISNAGIAVSS